MSYINMMVTWWNLRMNQKKHDLSFICDYSPEKYVNIYYNPDKGEDYRNARVLYSIWLYVVMDILVILYMVFATRLFIKEIKYEQTLRKRERLE